MRHQPNRRDRQAAINTFRKSPYQSSGYRTAHGNVEGHNCTDCGWPLKATSSALFAGKTEEGERQFRHARCPSLSERRVLRAEALDNA